MMDEEEHRARGFKEDDEIVMPIPVFDDSSDEDPPVEVRRTREVPSVPEAVWSSAAASETQLMMDDEEHRARGFKEDDEIVMPIPVFDDSSDED